MSNQEIIEFLKPITERQKWCPDCKRFLNPDEIRYASGDYCIHHIHNNLSIESTFRAYQQIVDDLVGKLEE